ncbi:MAG TPA: FAD binding domain-containing protein [Usitatibacter sp.]|nr:FAD binding domain-containing protein [Usitatibacter sp.]
MLPPRFELHRPQALGEAVETLARHADDASPFAGGTELLIAMKARVLRFGHLVDIKRLPELRGVRGREDGGVSIGALCSHHELARDPLVRERLPAYSALSENIANIRVRVAGTIGGNLCFAEPHTDPPALLCALDASVELAGPNGRRTLPLEEFLQGELSTARADDELMVRVEVASQPSGTRAAYRSCGHLERPAVGVAAVAVPHGAGHAWRLRASGLCGRPTALARTQAAMSGLPADEALQALLAHVGEDAAQVEAHDDLQGSAEYKRHLVTVLAARVARIALGRPERNA